MIRDGIYAFKDKRVLLLQGPLGPFFRRLASDLECAGAKVFKVNFNGGDWFFYPSGAINFRKSMEEWPAFFERFIVEKKIDVVFLFGDCRPIHQSVREIAVRHGLEVGVFEEGYVRPDYITLERFGVNGHSLIPRDPAHYSRVKPGNVQPTERVGNTFWYATLWAALYYLLGSVLWPFFRKYRHHRPLSPVELWPWLKSVWRKGCYAVKERGIYGRLTGPFSNQFFLVPLQVHYDAQIHTHSRFDSVENFIGEVVESFAAHAPKEAVLVFKHHPMDRGYVDYTSVIRSHISRHNLDNRCLYIHDQFLPELLKKARGVVVVNSTVGLSALYHGAPVKVCGNSIYDIKGLTYQGPLSRFWKECANERPDPSLFERFRSYLITHTQLNGSFYKRLPINGMRTGIRWAESERPDTCSSRTERLLISPECAGTLKVKQ